MDPTCEDRPSAHDCVVFDSRLILNRARGAEPDMATNGDSTCDSREDIHTRTGPDPCPLGDGSERVDQSREPIGWKPRSTNHSATFPKAPLAADGIDERDPN